MGLFVRLTLAIAAAIVVLFILLAVLKIVAAAAIIAAVVIGVLFAIHFIRGWMGAGSARHIVNR
jgi:hypothetical protein